MLKVLIWNGFLSFTQLRPDDRKQLQSPGRLMDHLLTLLSFGNEGWGDEIAAGTLLTIALALATLPLGLLQGFLLALAKNSDDANLHRAADIYTTIFRGLPELMTLFLVYYGVQIGLQALIGFFAEGVYIEINSFLAGMVALGVVFSSYSSEVFLSAFRGISHGQYEGGLRARAVELPDHAAHHPAAAHPARPCPAFPTFGWCC